MAQMLTKDNVRKMRLTKRLPDGQAVVDCENCERHEKGCTAFYCRNRLKDALAQYEDADAVEQMPTVDAVPVVRCRNCQNSYEGIDGRICSFGPCVDCVVPDDFFCSQGERGESNADR